MTAEANAYGTVSFLTDYGMRDEFVGVCKAVMLGYAPDIRILDISHDVPAHDIRAGALTLARAVPYLPAGIVLAVVDPTVGTDRRLVAVEVENGLLVGPDNGILAPAVAVLGGAQRVVDLTNTDYHLETPGATFAGRDVLAPVVGHLASGVSMTELGDLIDPVLLMPGMIPLPEFRIDGAIVGEVLWVDHFGNCQLNLGTEDLRAQGGEVGASLELTLRGETHRVRWVETYAEARPSELVVVVDSYGLVSLALDRSSAAALTGLGVGSGYTLAPVGTLDGGE